MTCQTLSRPASINIISQSLGKKSLGLLPPLAPDWSMSCLEWNWPPAHKGMSLFVGFEIKTDSTAAFADTVAFFPQCGSWKGPALQKWGP